MKTTTRNRAAALGVAALTGLAGIAATGSPALADSTGASATASSADVHTGSSVGSQSVYYPTNPVTYADELVRAWGAGSMVRVEAFSSTTVYNELSEHGSANGTHWKRVGAEGAAGTVYVDYENTVTGETMSLGVSNEAVSNPDNEWGTPHAVNKISFGD